MVKVVRLRLAATVLAVSTAIGVGGELVQATGGGPATARPAMPPVAPSTAAPPVPAPRPPIPISVRTDARVVALSFDDGPDPRWTQPVLDAMAAAGARATFFVTGGHARAHPDLVRAAAAAGHEIANHTDTHPLITELTTEAVTEEVWRTETALDEIGVSSSPLFRPPRGRYDEGALAAVEAAGLDTVGWSVCLERWLRRKGPVLGVEETVARVKPGGIILAHDGGPPDRELTASTLPLLLARLAEEGYQVVTVTELLRHGPVVPGIPGDAGPPPILASLG